MIRATSRSPSSAMPCRFTPYFGVCLSNVLSDTSVALIPHSALFPFPTSSTINSRDGRSLKTQNMYEVIGSPLKKSRERHLLLDLTLHNWKPIKWSKHTEWFTCFSCCLQSLHAVFGRDWMIQAIIAWHHLLDRIAWVGSWHQEKNPWNRLTTDRYVQPQFCTILRFYM